MLMRFDARMRCWLQLVALAAAMLLAGENAFGQAQQDPAATQTKKPRTTKSAAKSSSGGSSSSGTSGGGSSTTSTDGTTATASSSSGDAAGGATTSTTGGGSGGGSAGGGSAGGASGGGATGSTTSDPLAAADLLQLALQNNPDIQVARAKVAEAEAELRRIQLQVARQVFTQRQAVEQHRTHVRRLRGGAATPEELSAAVSAQAAAESELQFLTGSIPDAAGAHAAGGFGGGAFGGGMSGGGFGGRMGGFSGAASGVAGGGGMPGLGRTERGMMMGGGLGRMSAGPEAPPALPDETSAERMRENLAKSMRVQFSGDLTKLIEYLNNDHGIRFVADKRRLDNAGVEMAMDIGDLKPGTMSLGVLLQLIEDLHSEIAFVVRDYGILITAADDLPPGSVKVREFRLPEAVLVPRRGTPTPKSEKFRQTTPAQEPQQ